MYARILPFVFFHAALFAQSTPQSSAPNGGLNEGRIERCDRLPIVKVHIGATEMRFLVDTAATSLLNIKSFARGDRTWIRYVP